MSRSFRRKDRMAALSEINVTPLIDLAFALLIIFMIAAPLLEQSIPLILPVESASPQLSADRDFESISINQEGDVFWGEKSVSKTELSDLLAEAAAQALPPVIHIRGDASIPYQSIFTIIDMVKEHNLSEISLDTNVR